MVKKTKDGCWQFTYCNECMLYPMGLGCPHQEEENDKEDDSESNNL